MAEIIAAMGLFTLVVVLLATAVLLVRHAVISERPVEITINRQQTLTVASGDSLLWTLARAGIMLPAACGGRGSCGQCRVRVLAGGGPMLPIESNHISRRQAGRGERLACMVTVHEPLNIEVPPQMLEARTWHCSVQSSRFLAPLLKELTFAVDADEPLDYQPGDWIMLHAPPGRLALADMLVDERFRSDWMPLRDLVVEWTQPEVRAYSLASYPGERLLRLVIRLATPPPRAASGTPPGKVSSYAFSLASGDSVTVSGPFGDFHLRATAAEKVFVGGGAGIAPLRSMILHLLLHQKTTAPVSFWYGARSLREICYREEFEKLAAGHRNFSYHAALSEPMPGDAWRGPVGFIHNVVLAEYLDQHPAPEEAEYYLCGPPVMRRAVVTMLEDLGVERSSIHFDDFGG